MDKLCNIAERHVIDGFAKILNHTPRVTNNTVSWAKVSLLHFNEMEASHEVTVLVIILT